MILCPEGLTTFNQIESFFAQFYLCLTTSPAHTLKLDLDRVPFIRPAGIVALISCARIWQRQSGGYIEINCIQPKVYAYLERMNLFAEYGDILHVTPGVPPTEGYYRSYQSNSLLEILAIPSDEAHNANCVPGAVARAQQILEGWYGHNANVTRLCMIFSELITNVVHSEVDGYALIQSYTDNLETGKRVELAIGDTGIGIQASLLSNPQIVVEATRKHWDKGSDFILYALEEGVSSKTTLDGIERGLGLTDVRQKVGKWDQSMLRIRSNRSMIELSHQQIEPSRRDGLTNIAGTQVVISISAKVFSSN